MNFRLLGKHQDMVRGHHLNEDMVVIIFFLSLLICDQKHPRGFDFILGHAQTHEQLMLSEAYGWDNRNTIKGLQWDSLGVKDSLKVINRICLA